MIPAGSKLRAPPPHDNRLVGRVSEALVLGQHEQSSLEPKRRIELLTYALRV
jgi:hypothetical protein